MWTHPPQLRKLCSDQLKILCWLKWRSLCLINSSAKLICNTLMIWREKRAELNIIKNRFKTGTFSGESPAVLSLFSHDLKSQSRLSMERSCVTVCLRTCRERATAAVHHSRPEPRREETGAGLNTEQPPCESCWSLRHRRQSSRRYRDRHTPISLPSLHLLPHYWSRGFCWRDEITWRELLMWKWHRTY